MSNIQNKERMLKVVRENLQLTCKSKHSLPSILKARRAWNTVFQVQKVSNCHLRLMCTEKLSFKTDGERRTFQHNYRLRQFMTTKAALQNTLHGGWRKSLNESAKQDTFHDRKKLTKITRKESSVSGVHKLLILIGKREKNQSIRL